jgi:CBS domain-containing protein
MAKMKSEGGNMDERLRTLTRVTMARQRKGRPVHGWKLASLSEGQDWQNSFRTVGQFMDRDLFTVREADIVDLAATLMEWEYVRYILVEDDTGRLVGLVSYAQLLKLVSRRFDQATGTITVGSIMRRDPPTATPQTSTYDAISLMRESGLGCLPVLFEDKLVGIVTERHFMDVAQRLMERGAKVSTTA